MHYAAVQDRVGKLTPLLSDVSAIAVICLLLFLEEAGLPLLFAPGEAVLLGAGLLISAGAAPAWCVIPLAYLSVLGGVATGYWWANRIGSERLRSLAWRLHAGGPYDRATGRLRAATPLQIAGSRLLPGLRFNYDQKDVDFDQQIYGGLQTTNAALIALQQSILAPQSYKADVSDTNTSGQITLAYKIASSVNAYGTYATGFKSL